MDSNNNNLELNDSQMSRTDLESHANVVVLGNNCAIIKRTGRYSGAAPFAPDYEILHKVLIINSSIECHDQCSGEMRLLVLHGVL